ncbi:MAG: BolA family transcriptional regulator [Myxococcota bacterium]
MFSAERIQSLIEAALPDCTARVLDPARDGQHFQAEVTSTAFVGASRVEQHQLVYRALGDHMRSDIHALQLKTYTPEAWPHGSGDR